MIVGLRLVCILLRSNIACLQCLEVWRKPLLWKSKLVFPQDLCINLYCRSSDRNYKLPVPRATGIGPGNRGDSVRDTSLLYSFPQTHWMQFEQEPANLCLKTGLICSSRFHSPILPQYSSPIHHQDEVQRLGRSPLRAKLTCSPTRIQGGMLCCRRYG